MKVSLRIPNWNKHNSGNFKLKYKHWFKNKADIIYSPGLLGLSPGQKWFWIYILAQTCAQNNGDTVCLNLQHAVRTTELELETIFQAIEILKENDTIEIVGDFTTPLLSPKGENALIDKSRVDKIRLDKNRIDKIREEKEVSTEPIKPSVAVVTEKVSKDGFKDFFNEKLLKLYPQDYIDREKIKMELWLTTNPQKNPKSTRGWTRFITGWLERGWDGYRKGLATEKPKKKSWMDLADEREAEEKRMKENGEIPL